MKNSVMVWLSVFVSLSYCYFVGKFVPKGIPRLVVVLPILCLFLVVPLNLSSMHIGGMTAFFIAWLANFKLLLFAFGRGPLSSDPTISLGRFIALACFPIKIQHHPLPKPGDQPKNTQNGETPSEKPHSNGQTKENPTAGKSRRTQKSPINYAIKVLLLALFMRVYDYSEHLHPKVILIVYSFHIYFALEIMLAVVAVLVGAFLGVELEPQFNEPYLSTSLQEFWGRRWNIMVSSILRPTVYEPILQISKQVVGSKWATLPAIMGTFVVSAIMHELMFYYLGRVKPTWEITWFFLLHGVCLIVEIALKKTLDGKFQLPRLISRILTVGFVLATGFWLFFPQLLRCRGDVRAFEEYTAVASFFRDTFRGLTLKSLNASSTL